MHQLSQNSRSRVAVLYAQKPLEFRPKNIQKIVIYFKILTWYSPGESPDRTAGNVAEIKSENTSLERYRYTNQVGPKPRSPEIGSELVFMPKRDEHGHEKVTKILVEITGHRAKERNLDP
jgi:hypothetical protein